jgi:hypothetical protein
VFAAWAFYYDHRDEIDRHLAEAAAMEANYPADDARRAKLMQRYHANKDDLDAE